MCKFITVKSHTGREVAINVDHIVSVEDCVTTCYIYLTSDGTQQVQSSIEVKHTFQQIMDMINS